MARVFLSYATADNEAVERLGEALTSHAVDVWRDKEQLRMGQFWPMALGEAIADSDGLVLLWSQQAHESHWVGVELNIALAVGRPVFPVVLDTTTLPAILAAVHAHLDGDLTAAARAIAEALARLSSARPARPKVMAALRDVPPDADNVVARMYAYRPHVLAGIVADESGRAVPKLGLALDIGGAPQVTDEFGRFQFVIPPALKPGSAFRILARGDDWTIHRPAAGRGRIPAHEDDVLQIEVLPPRHPALLGASQISALVEGAATQSVEQPGAAPREAFAVSLEEWARESGFAVDVVRQKVDEWAEKERDGEDLGERGLKALARREFARAAELFGEAADTAGEAAAAQSVWGLRLHEAHAYAADQRFSQAIEAYHKALESIDADANPTEWGTTQNALGIALQMAGIRSEGVKSVGFLRESAGAFRAALAVRARIGATHECALTQSNLAESLRHRALRAGGEQGEAYLRQAKTACEEALAALTADEMFGQRATVQSNLGNVILAQGLRRSGEKRSQLLGEAAQTYESALASAEKAQAGELWSVVKGNLGEALREQARVVAGEAGVILVGRAIGAYRDALSLQRSPERRYEWARTQNNLGLAQAWLGAQTGGVAGTVLLGEAVEAYENALTVFSRETHADDWARTQNNLGHVLLTWTSAAAGLEQRRLFEASRASFHRALAVWDAETARPNWALVQINLAALFTAWGQAEKGAEQVRLWREALKAIDGVLPDCNDGGAADHREALERERLRLVGLLGEE